MKFEENILIEQDISTALKEGCYEIVKYLVQIFDNDDSSFDLGFMKAYQKRDIDCIKFLIENCSNVHRKKFSRIILGI